MADSKKIIITCCGGPLPSLKSVSVARKADRSTCGEIPCDSTPQPAGSSPCKTCSPDLAGATLEEKCYPQRYLTRVSSVPQRNSQGAVIGSITKTTSWAHSPSCVGIEAGWGYNTSVCGNLSIGGYTNTYSNPTPIVQALNATVPIEFPNYPLFIDPRVSLPISDPLLLGQSRGSFIKNLDRESIQKKDSIKCKYRIEHLPVVTNYLKVWLRKRITAKYQWIVPSGKTCPEWVLIPGTYPQFSELTSYEWESSSPIVESPTIANTIISNETEISAASGEVASVEIYKYSYVKNYIPEDPNPTTGAQLCRPNGWPLIKC